jgi:hypothetical protein
MGLLQNYYAFYRFFWKYVCTVTKDELGHFDEKLPTLCRFSCQKGQIRIRLAKKFQIYRIRILNTAVTYFEMSVFVITIF